MKSPKLVLIVPCFNESKRISFEYFDKIKTLEDVQLLFVDDGSRDNTLELLMRYAVEGSAEILALKENKGKAQAITEGIRFLISQETEGKWVGFIDADQAFDLKTVFETIGLIHEMEPRGFEAIYSSRVKLLGRRISRKTSRHYLSRVISTFFGVVWKTIPYDTQSGFKLYLNSKEFRLAFSKIRFKTRWFFDIETHIELCSAYGRNINAWEQPVYSWVDVKGSRITNLEKFRIIYEIFLVFSKIWTHRNILSKFPTQL